MSKKVLIDKQALIDKLMKIPGIGSNSDALKTIKRFPSYEPQKVKAPQFVADWFEENKHNLSNSLWKFTAELNEKTLVTGAIYTEFESWFIAQPRVYEFITRMGKGYEVVEEPRWIVCYSTMYLKSPIETGQIESVEITPKKELAYHFKSYKEAKQQTSLIGGAVERV
ncbi:DUF1642 domain-containing protein [Enterococcus pseudoavium]|uniref:DUF1642 domain-containing protein n=1 Tax=Enterococcus pseudoavium TaxID=44007 RepID=A0ABU3FKH3_9ENTE|nr:DUF1642 domain-containing protein [Enterococcus pseudoavium]MDT2771578.1 DUF1642 domain-containing protein [Enterococcus pseudoavium]